MTILPSDSRTKVWIEQMIGVILIFVNERINFKNKENQINIPSKQSKPSTTLVISPRLSLTRMD